MNAERREKLKQLRRRRDFLADRIATYNKGGNDSYDRIECKAITWAIQIIEAAEKEGVLIELEQVVTQR